MKAIKIIAASILLLGFLNTSLAGSVVSCATKSGSYDYGNATGQESSACHSTDQWQKLGGSWNSESSNKGSDPSYKPSESDLSTNDGVTWRTSTDGGDTWSEYTNTAELTSGGLVEFQFEVTRSIEGNHKYDQLEAWVDWSQNGEWNDTNDENIISKQWWKNTDANDEAVTLADLDPDLIKNNYNNYSDGTKNWDLSNYYNETTYNSQDTTRMYTSGAIQIPVYDTLTEVWLRARIVCENSLEHYSDGMNLIATGFQDQGEVEDYKLTIAKKPKKTPTEVPEPSTIFIFAIALIALGTQRKKLKKHK